MFKRVARWLSAATIVVMGFASGVGCKGAVQPPNSCPMPEKPAVAAMPVVKKGIFIDPELPWPARDVMVSAMLEWTQRTRGVVQWDIKDHLTEEEMGQGPDGVCSNTLVMTVLPEDSTLVKKVEKTMGKKAAAFTLLPCETKLTVIVMERIESRAQFKAVVQHELGHYLGLDDSEVEGSVMYYASDKIGACVTKSDAEAFCKAWKCDAKKLDPCQ